MGDKTRNIYFQLVLQKSCKTSCRFLLPFFRIPNFTSWSRRPDNIELRNMPQPTPPFLVSPHLRESGFCFWNPESHWRLQIFVAVFPYPKFYVVVAQAGQQRIKECTPTNLPVPSFTPSEGIRILLLESGIPWRLQVFVAIFPYPKFTSWSRRPDSIELRNVPPA